MRRWRSSARRPGFPWISARAYWTPPLTPKLAYETEKNQIEDVLGLKSLVSLTDHDNIEAPLWLRGERETAQTPISLEWSVPFQGTIFHLGVHNLPGGQAQSIMDELAGVYEESERDAFTRVAGHAAMDFRMCWWCSTIRCGRRLALGCSGGDQVLERFLKCGGAIFARV